MRWKNDSPRTDIAKRLAALEATLLRGSFPTGDRESRKRLADAWRRGEAWRELLDVGVPDAKDGGQQGWVTRFEAAPPLSSTVWKISRQRGKSFAAVFGAGEQYAQRTPGAIVRYLGQTGESAESILEPTFKQIFELCPDEQLLPEPFRSTGRLGSELRWDNGATFVWSGTDNDTFRRQRGPRTHRLLLDESGFYPKLTDVEQALLPSLQTTGGKALYLCSPPLSPGHEFEARYMAAVVERLAEHDTIFGNPRMTAQDIENLIKREAARLGMSVEEFIRSTYWRREYLAQTVVEETRAAVPSWNEERAAAIVQTVERPKFFDAYVGCDWGFGDPHGVTFGYWDFERSLLVIEDELWIRQGNTEVLANAIKAKERELYGNEQWDGRLFGLQTVPEMLASLPDWLRDAARGDAPRQPFLRVGDDDLQVCADLHQLHGLSVLPTKKQDNALHVNELDIMVRNLQLRIHPRCKRLIKELYTVLWNRQRTDWERTPEGHGDVLKSLVYMARNLSRHRDPRPVDEIAQGVTVGTMLRERQRIEERQRGLADAFMGDSKLARRLRGGR